MKRKPPGLSSDVALRMSMPSGPGLREIERSIAGRLLAIGDLGHLLGKRRVTLARVDAFFKKMEKRT